jgi:translation initiation factor 2D
MDHPFPYVPNHANHRQYQTNIIILPTVHWNQEKNPTPVLVPTVALLSVLYIHMPNIFREHIIPTITIPSNITKFLCRGAHLMRAGMASNNCSMPYPSECLRHTRGLVALAVHGNTQPFATGFLTPGTTPEALQTYHTRNGQLGIGVFIVTCYGDDLWRDCFKHMGHHMKCSLGLRGDASQKFEDGSYGNSGFLDGRIVRALQVDLSSRTSDDSEEEYDRKSHGYTSPIMTGFGDMLDTLQEKADNDVDNKGQNNASVKDLDESLFTEGNKVDFEHCDLDSSLEPNDNTVDSVADTPNTAAHQVQDPSLDTSRISQRHDDILLQAFYRSLLTLKKTDLPILVSTYYSKFLLPIIPPDTSFDLKLTKYKKLGPFLREQADKRLISLGSSKDGHDPLAFLTDYNRTHVDLRESRSQRNSNSNYRQDHISDENKKLNVVNLYTVPQNIVSLLGLHDDAVKARNAKSEQRRGTGFLTAPECRDILEHYLVVNNLLDPMDPQIVLINGPLCDALFKHVMKQASATGNSHAYPDRFTRKDLHQIWIDSLDDAFAIVSMPGSNIVTMKRGSIPKVLIEVTTRQGNKKFITRVRNLEEFGIIPQIFCQDVSKRFACAGTIDEDCTGRETLKKGCVEVIFQGNLSDELKALLTGDESFTHHGGAKDSIYCIPKSVIQIRLQKGVKKSKS